MTSLRETPRTARNAGELNAAISKAVVRLYSEYVGRGPTKARTIHSGKFVLCVLEDTMTRAERSLSAGGHEDFVLQARHALQHTMQQDLTAAVEAFTHRKVVAMLSANHIEPDLAAEVFMLDEPLSESAKVMAPFDGARPAERDPDRSSQEEESQ
jgi:uncharacterized protein YbcI